MELINMVGMENLVPKWLGHGVHDMADDDTPPPLPTIAKLPEPITSTGETEAERDARVYGEAAVRADRVRRLIEAEAELRRTTEAENAELRKELEAERRISGLMRLELSETQNNLQAMASQLVDYSESFQRIAREIERHGKRTPKKNGKKNGENSNAP
jgi:hypothetical protein